MYAWDRVASRTVQVYEKVLEKKRLTFLQRLARYKTVGSFSGYVVCLIAVSLHFLLNIIEWMQPRNQIDIVPDLERFDAGELLQLMNANRREIPISNTTQETRQQRPKKTVE